MDSQKTQMWDNQILFRKLAQRAADEVFSLLDPELSPEIFLAGVMFGDNSEMPSICLEQRTELLDISSFTEIYDLVKQMKNISKEKPAILEELFKNSLSNLLHLNPKLRSRKIFASVPVPVGNYLVSVVLLLDKKTFDNYPGIDLSRFSAGSRQQSLISAAAEEILAESTKAMRENNPGASLNTFNRSPEGIIRSAGKNLMVCVARTGKPIDYNKGLFHSCNMISSLKYESGESQGKLIVSKRGHLNINEVIILDHPVPLSDYRAARKLLELSSADLYMLTDSEVIFGFGQLITLFDDTADDIFIINISSYYKWELINSGAVIMEVNYGQPKLPRSAIEFNYFAERLQDIFPELNSNSVTRFWDLVQSIIRTKSGAALIISKGAKAESERLSRQCIKIAPFDLKPHILSSLVHIDGAVLADTHGYCHAVGVILDGLANDTELRARGARYNSAVRYVKTSRYPCLAVVFSEDRTIDIIS